MDNSFRKDLKMHKALYFVRIALSLDLLLKKNRKKSILRSKTCYWYEFFSRSHQSVLVRDMS